MAALSADLQPYQRESAEYSSTFVPSTSTITLASCSLSTKSEAPHTPYRNVHLDPPSRRPKSFVTAEGYIIEELPRPRSVSEPSRPKHRRFHSTPNASSPAPANHPRAKKFRRSTTSSGYSARRSSPLAFPPSLPVPPVPPIPHVPVPYREDLTSSPDSPELLPPEPLPASSVPIWPSSPRRTKRVTQSMKLKKRRPVKTIEPEPVRPSFGGTSSPDNTSIIVKYLRRNVLSRMVEVIVHVQKPAETSRGNTHSKYTANKSPLYFQIHSTSSCRNSFFRTSDFLTWTSCTVPSLYFLRIDSKKKSFLNMMFNDPVPSLSGGKVWSRSQQMFFCFEMYQNVCLGS